MSDLIISPTNPLIKRIRALALRKHRASERAFFVEGIAPTWAAIEADPANIEVVVVAPDLLTSESARQMLETARKQGIRIANVDRRIFESFAGRDNPSGLGAIVRMSAIPLDELRVTSSSLLIALDGVANPGNLGTIIRTADAAGASGVLLIGETTDEYHPGAVKASMGTLFHVPIVHLAHSENLFAWCESSGVTVITTSAHAEQVYARINYHLPVLFLFGSEGEGLSKELLARGSRSVRIPMAGTATSLNLAVAVGVLLYEVRRQSGVDA